MFNTIDSRKTTLLSAKLSQPSHCHIAIPSDIKSRLYRSSVDNIKDVYLEQQEISMIVNSGG
ncbi:hypothetical protein PGT21_028184 [Puccinia graminis f. sp. tritici]|uniref:Uncharacterized protein n=1 Tax=Puccinia graminis f. sp. tritici TaxID=56615 RepID=A0A5B0MY80_PUCGR|nr:hypothetical protein PGT21_028184 [Puccinia graminis f. sp. tritici]KAA1131204.1 hypothetical protein PGTUg99_023812 [Puccinia graminis f. sp. tritici]